MKIAVLNQTEVEADIETLQISKYLTDHGWKLTIDKIEDHFWEFWEKKTNGREVFVDIPIKNGYNDVAFANCLVLAINKIAQEENRQPGDVLLDIAKVVR